jgi:hypothetical protein
MRAPFTGLALAIVIACKQPQDPGQDAQASPQASAEPAPIATPAIASGGSAPDSGPPPSPLRADVPLEGELSGKDTPGYTLAVVIRMPDAPAVATTPGVAAQVIDSIRRQNEPRFTIDLTSAHMRMQIASAGFVVPENSEVRSRADRYGHVLVSADGTNYRTLAPGSLRALFQERRIDVSPLSPADVVAGPEGTRRLSYRTRKVDVSNRAGRVSLEIAKLPELGEGGGLLVRALLDLVNAAPSTQVVGPDEVPLHAELHWPLRGALFFDVTAIIKRTDFTPQQFSVPPRDASYMRGPLPPMPSELHVQPKDLSSMHTGPADIGMPRAAASGTLLLVNTHDTPRFAWVDGAPIAWVAPEAQLEIGPLPRGRYQVEWRTFLDDDGEPSKVFTVPPLPVTTKDGGAP